MALGTAFGAFTLYYANQIEPNWIEVTHHTVTLPRLDPAFNGYRIAQISDIHVDTWMHGERLQRAVDLLNREHADLVVITGDFVSRRVIYDADQLANALKAIQSEDGVLAIPGNHDHYNDNAMARIREILASTNIVDLSNRIHTLKRSNAQLCIAGIDDVVQRRARLDLILDSLPQDTATILLAHEPDVADIIAPLGRFDLQLSGHTHGGQLRLPFIGALISPKHGRRYDMGWFRINDLQLYVNRGLGMVTMRLRFNCRPEISVFTLQAT